MYSSASCYPSENEEHQQPQDRRQEDTTTTSPLLVAAAGRLSSRRSSQQSQDAAPLNLLSQPALVSARLPTATFDLEDDDLTISNTSSIGTAGDNFLSSGSSRRENTKPSTDTAGDRHSANMSRIAKILDQALEILKSGDEEYSLDDDRLDRSTISCDPSSFFY